MPMFSSFSPLPLLCSREVQGPDGQPGYQHILKLAMALLEARSLQGLSDKRVDRLIVLWDRLPEHDKRRVVYPPRHQERQPRGAVQASEGEEHLLSWEGESPTVRLGSNVAVSSRNYLLYINWHCPLHDCPSAVFSDKPRALQTGPVPAAWWRPFAASSAVSTLWPRGFEGP